MMVWERRSPAHPCCTGAYMGILVFLNGSAVVSELEPDKMEIEEMAVPCNNTLQVHIHASQPDCLPQQQSLLSFAFTCAGC